jgi:CDP-diacylglycerol pyrophosphatase
MHVVSPRCCGLDVHKETISPCILIADESGGKAKHRGTFRTMTLLYSPIAPINGVRMLCSANASEHRKQ